VDNGWTSVKPLRLDLTDESALSDALEEMKLQFKGSWNEIKGKLKQSTANSPVTI
jgi:hypothetical protein